MSRILQPSKSAFRAAVEALRAGCLVGIPTETVYGLAANAWDEQAVEGIYHAKGRPLGNPLIVHLASLAELDRAVAWPLSGSTQATLDKLSCFMPGPLTLVLSKGARIAHQATAGLSTVAIRVPNHPIALEILRRCEFPLAAPSANVSNYVSPTTAEHVAQGLGDHVALVLDGGPCADGLESTIVSLASDPPRLLRSGAISAEEIALLLEMPADVLLRDEPAKAGALRRNPTSLEAPGMLPRHYAPRTPMVFLRRPRSRLDPAARVGLIAFRRQTLGDFPATQVELLSETGDLREVARGLFSAIRRLDQAGLDVILVDDCPLAGLGRAIMDRLERACRRASEQA